MSYLKDISDIPLKPSQETFVDEPSSLEDVHLEELIFDLEHGIKDINKLHVYHAIAIVNFTLESIIKLYNNQELLEGFRKDQLNKYNLRTPSQDNDSPVSNIVPTPSQTTNTSPILPPLKCAKISPDLDQEIIKETTPDSLSNNNEQDETDNDSEADDNQAKIIPIEELVADLSLETVKNPITGLDANRLQNELNYFEKPQINEQTIHLIKTFNLVKIPNISIEDFLIRIKTYSSSISVLSYIHAAFMIYKLSIILAVVPLSSFNVYRLLLALIRCLAKTLEDVYQKQKSFATVGGVSPKELFKIEVGFLYLCNFRVVIGESILNNFLKKDLLDLYKFCKKSL